MKDQLNVGKDEKRKNCKKERLNKDEANQNCIKKKAINQYTC